MFNNDIRLKDNYKYNKTSLDLIEKNYYKSYHSVDLIERYDKKNKPTINLSDYNYINNITFINESQFNLFNYYLNNISALYQNIEMYNNLIELFQTNYIKNHSTQYNREYNITISNYEEALLSHKKKFIYSTNYYSNSIINFLSDYTDKISKCILIFPIILFLMIIAIYYKIIFKLKS